MKAIKGLDIAQMGTHGLLLRTDNYRPAVLGATIRDLALDGVSDVVPAETTLLVRCDHAAAQQAVQHWLEELIASYDESPLRVDREPIEIPVRYDGEDLAFVAEACSLSKEEVIRRHLGSTYVAAFCGFAPGFAYLSGLDSSLQLPRRNTPRTRVPAGTVAIAATYSAVYPQESPGGWHLIGSTSTEPWDIARQPPALIEPGRQVRFVRQ
ncbi:MAG: allophanate hydrolase subunit 1 [Actinomycetota bacterium]|nr:allophanate hydrolase subunit 1 [Actinomycetota bacterium]MEC8502666.1 allophanate hydrolase subunit 1 [Actinomycetota bacterium]MEC8522570.1 allophanate hydrolase subunit 1 [Actinomycetota bacterium]MEC9224315.1 allophanate hydrolase subunit 1 [Actinomycetota bacterium]